MTPLTVPNLTPMIVDPLAHAMGQMNLHGVPIAPPPPGSEAIAADSSEKATEKVKSDDDELDDVEEEITYKSYRPAKLRYGKDHPDPVVENSTLAAVAPPDITYNLAMPANIIYEGKLSNLQLEAVVYGCQRHMVSLLVELWLLLITLIQQDSNSSCDLFFGHL